MVQQPNDTALARLAPGVTEACGICSNTQRSTGTTEQVPTD